MTNLLSGHWKQYFQMPIADVVERLDHPAHRYYSFLCREMNVHSAVDLRYSNAEIAQATGIKDPKTIKKARKELQVARLVEIHRVPPGIYAHVMLDQDGSPIPPPDGRKGIRQYSSGSDRRTKTARESRGSHPESPQPPRPGRSEELAHAYPFLCYACKGTEFWTREGARICSRCHPNPHRTESWNPPTAGEIGFE
jgi:hypothetical protein